MMRESTCEDKDYDYVDKYNNDDTEKEVEQ